MFTIKVQKNDHSDVKIINIAVNKLQTANKHPELYTNVVANLNSRFSTKQNKNKTNISTV